MLIRFTNNRATATVKLGNTLKNIAQITRKAKFKISWPNPKKTGRSRDQKTRKYIKIIISGGRRHDTPVENSNLWTNFETNLSLLSIMTPGSSISSWVG